MLSLLRFNALFLLFQKNILLRLNDFVSVVASSRLKSPPVFECKMPKSLTQKTVFSRHLFADVISVHNGNMKLACRIEFDHTNLLAML